jgi:hypothetical protein
LPTKQALITLGIENPTPVEGGGAEFQTLGVAEPKSSKSVYFYWVGSLRWVHAVSAAVGGIPGKISNCRRLTLGELPFKIVCHALRLGRRLTVVVVRKINMIS